MMLNRLFSPPEFPMLLSYNISKKVHFSPDPLKPSFGTVIEEEKDIIQKSHNL